MKVSAEFIKELEEQVSAPWFVREWFRKNVPKKYLSTEAKALIGENPYTEPDKAETETLEEVERNLYGFLHTVAPYLVRGIYEANTFHYIHAWDRGILPEWLVPVSFKAIGRRRFLYFETLEDLLRELMDLACILVAFSKTPRPLRKVLMPPEQEEFEEAYSEYRKKHNIPPFNAAIEGSKKHVKKNLIKEIELELSTSEWIALKVGELRRSLEFLVDRKEKRLERKLLSVVARARKSLGLVDYIFSKGTFCSYFDNFPKVYLFELHDNYDPFIEAVDVKQHDFIEFEIMKEEDPLYVYSAVVGRSMSDIKLTGEDFVLNVINLLKFLNHNELTSYITDFFGERLGKRLLIKAGIEPNLSRKKSLRKLKNMHDSIMEEFDEKAISKANLELMEQAYQVYMEELKPEVISDLPKNFFASVVNVINYFLLRKDLERAKALLKKAEEAGLANVTFLELYGKLGEAYLVKFQTEASYEEDSLIEEARRWLEKFYEFIYLREQVGELEKYLSVVPLIYFWLFDYTSALLYIATHDEEDNEDFWEEIGKRIDFTLHLVEKYKDKPLRWKPMVVQGALMQIDAELPEEVEDIYYEHRVWCYINKVIYLDYSYEEGKAQELLNFVAKTTPKRLWELFREPIREHLQSWEVNLDLP